MTTATVTKGSGAVRTVGVDVAKDPQKTALCVICWTDTEAVVELLELRVNDERIVELACASNTTALDAPFGWPRAMVNAVSEWTPGGRWSRPKDRAFRLRATDEHIKSTVAHEVGRRSAPARQGVDPLSVSSDKIAMAAWRVCGVLDSLGPKCSIVTDILGTTLKDGPHVVEAYPAAALAMWSVDRTGYKAAKDEAVERRRAMIATIKAKLRRPLRWTGALESICSATDHALDAFVCALVARSAALGEVHAVPDEHRDDARKEGWIALPFSDALVTL